MGTIADMVIPAAKQRQVLPPIGDLRLGRLTTVHGTVEELDATNGRREMLPPGEYRVLVHVRPSRPVAPSFLESESARADRAEAKVRHLSGVLGQLAELLPEVLDDAGANAYIAAHERNVTKADHDQTAAEIARIDRISGLIAEFTPAKEA